MTFIHFEWTCCWSETDCCSAHSHTTQSSGVNRSKTAVCIMSRILAYTFVYVWWSWFQVGYCWISIWVNIQPETNFTAVAGLGQKGTMWPCCPVLSCVYFFSPKRSMTFVLNLQLSEENKPLPSEYCPALARGIFTQSTQGQVLAFQRLRRVGNVA